MSILDSVMNMVEHHSGVSPQQHSTLVESAMQMLGNHEGLSGLVSNAESQGLGSVVQSWIGNGANQSVAPQQVQGLLGKTASPNPPAGKAFLPGWQAWLSRASCRCLSTSSHPVANSLKLRKEGIPET